MTVITDRPLTDAARHMLVTYRDTLRRLAGDLATENDPEYGVADDEQASNAAVLAWADHIIDTIIDTLIRDNRTRAGGNEQ